MPNDQTMKIKNEIHSSNIDKRGNVKKSLTKKQDNMQVGPIMLAVFLFVVIGSALFQILNVANRGSDDILA